MGQWPPPPDLASLKELVAAADPEGFLADGGPADEYDIEAEELCQAISTWATAELTAERLLPVIEDIWEGAFSLDDKEIVQRRPKLGELAGQIARFFGPDAQPRVRGERPVNFRKKLIELLESEARPEYKVGHQPRLYALTRAIAAKLDPPRIYDDDVVFAAAYLHDLGVFVGHRPEDPEELAAWDHVAYTCARAPRILSSIGFPEAKIEPVLACIREHQPKDRPVSFEAILLRDADILEQLGAIGILRTVAKVGSDTRFHTFADARHALSKALQELPPKILLPSARELAAPKIALLNAFLEQLSEEAGEHLG